MPHAARINVAFLLYKLYKLDDFNVVVRSAKKGRPQFANSLFRRIKLV